MINSPKALLCVASLCGLAAWVIAHATPGTGQWAQVLVGFWVVGLHASAVGLWQARHVRSFVRWGNATVLALYVAAGAWVAIMLALLGLPLS